MTHNPEARLIAELVVRAIEDAYDCTEQSVPRAFCGEATDAAYSAVMDALASSPPAPVPETMEVSEDTKRLDWLEGWAARCKSKGHKWDTFMVDFVKFATVRAAIDAAIAAQEAKS